MRRDTADTSARWSVRERRLQIAKMLGGSSVVSILVVVGYFVLPMDSALAADSIAELTGGLLLIAVLLAWQIRDIALSPYPGARALGAIMVTVPLFIALFATGYYVMGRAAPDSFSQSLTRLDSMYFTVSTFATVGFGDITADSEPARVLTTVQMVGDLVLVGLIARVVVGIVQESRTRHESRQQ